MFCDYFFFSSFNYCLPCSGGEGRAENTQNFGQQRVSQADNSSEAGKLMLLYLLHINIYIFFPGVFKRDGEEIL